MLQLYVAQDRCGWVDPSGGSHWDLDGDFDKRLERCIEDAAKAWPRRAWRRTRVQVWGAGGLCRPFLLGPVAGLKGVDEIRSFARSQVANATGWDEPCEVRLEGDITKGVVLATAIPTSVHAQIETLIRSAKLRLVSLRPWWAGALDEALATQPAPELLVIEEPDGLTLLAGRDGAWSLAEVFSPKPAADEPERTVRRLAAGVAIPPDASTWLRLNPATLEGPRAPWPGVERQSFGDRA